MTFPTLKEVHDNERYQSASSEDKDRIDAQFFRLASRLVKSIRGNQFRSEELINAAKQKGLIGEETGIIGAIKQEFQEQSARSQFRQTQIAEEIGAIPDEESELLKALARGITRIPTEPTIGLLAITGFEEQAKELSEFTQKLTKDQQISPEVAQKLKELAGKPERFFDADFWTINLAEQLPQAIPFFLLGAGSISLGGKIASRFGANQLKKRALQIGLGTATQTTLDSLITGADSFQRVLRDTGDEEKAGEAAASAVLNNIALSIPLNALSFGGIISSFGKRLGAASPSLKRKVLNNIARVSGVPVSIVSEVIQEVKQEKDIPEIAAKFAEGEGPKVNLKKLFNIFDTVNRIMTDPEAQDIAVISAVMSGLFQIPALGTGVSIEDQQTADRITEEIINETEQEEEQIVGIEQVEQEQQLQDDEDISNIIEQPPTEEAIAEEVPIEEEQLVEEEVIEEPIVQQLREEPTTEEELPTRAFAERFAETEGIAPEIIEGFNVEGQKYIPISNQVSLNEANFIIEQKGDDIAIRDVLNTSNEMVDRVRITLSQVLIKRANQKFIQAKVDNNIEEQEKQLDNTIIVGETASKLGTEDGQAIQAFVMWNQLEPEGIIRKATSDVNKARKEVLKRDPKAKNVPEITPEFARIINDLAAEIKVLPDNSLQQNRKIFELMKEIQKQIGVKYKDIAVSLLYANVLSGLSTQAINIVGSFSNTMLEIFTSIAVNKAFLQTPELLMSFYSGLIKGKLEALNTLKTGENPLYIDKKFEIPNASEVINFTGLAKPLNAAKYVRRSLIAGDTFIFKGGEEFRAHMIAMQEAKKAGLKGKELTRSVDNILHNTPQLREEARSQAILEKLEPGSTDFKRRVNQLIEQARPDELQEDAFHFGQRGTFNYTPQGILGLLQRNIANFTNAFLPAKLIIPFTRITTNVANVAIDYSPLGFTDKFMGFFGKSKLEGEAAQQQMARAVLGTTGMVVMALLDAMHADEEDPLFQIIANGPKTRKERFQWKENGGKEFSIKIGNQYISYKTTPFVVAFGIIGHYRDSIRYKKFNKEEEEDRLSIALMGGLQAFMEQSFLVNLADFFKALNTEDLKSAGRNTTNLFARITVSPLFPNLARQIDQFFDPRIFDANDIKRKMLRAVPIARRFLKPKLNVLGEEISRDNVFFGRILSKSKREDPVWNFIIDNQAWVSVPTLNQAFGDRRMQPDEYYDFMKIRGKIIKDELSLRVKKDFFKGLTKKQIQDSVSKLSGQATRIAKDQLRVKLIK